MATIGIEVVDAALVAVRDGESLASSPGVALLDPEGTLVGAEAAAAARLRPVLANDRFWSDLATDSLARPDPPVSHADLAHAQLSRSVAASPRTAMRRYLPCRVRCGCTRSACCSASRAASAFRWRASWMPPSRPARALPRALGDASRRAVSPGGADRDAGRDDAAAPPRRMAPRAGLKAIYSAWAQLVAEAMVRRTRFDPLHQAATEQQLYQRLPNGSRRWPGGRPWTSRSTRSQAASARRCGASSSRSRPRPGTRSSRNWYMPAIVRTSRRRSRCRARAALLPALGERLARCRASRPWCCRKPRRRPRAAADGPPKSDRRNRRRSRRRWRAAMPWGRRAPSPDRVERDARDPGRAGACDRRASRWWSGSALAAAGASRSAARAPASRARIARLCAAAARSIVRDHSRYGTFVNGERVDGEMPLGAGDRLRVGTPGVVLELVTVG